MVKKQNCVIWICFTVYIKRNDICKTITEDVEARFDTSNYGLIEPSLKVKM